MMRSRRSLTAAGLVGVGAVALAGCAPFPAAPSTVGASYPSTGVPTSVAWPSDWIGGLVGESDAVGGPVVGLRLEYVSERWVWRVRSTDPGRTDLLGEPDADPTSGIEALVDASDLTLVRKHDVTLTGAESAAVDEESADAVHESGERYPGPRLVELERVVEDRRPAWRVTTYDPDTGGFSSRTL